MLAYGDGFHSDSITGVALGVGSASASALFKVSTSGGDLNSSQWHFWISSLKRFIQIVTVIHSVTLSSYYNRLTDVINCLCLKCVSTNPLQTSRKSVNNWYKCNCLQFCGSSWWFLVSGAFQKACRKCPARCCQCVAVLCGSV